MNYYNVSTKEALQAGRMNLKYIPMALMFSGGIAVFFWLASGFWTDQPFENTGLPADHLGWFVGLPFAGVVASFVWRSFHSAAWKIWALENVQDAHRLYQLAVNEGFIYKRDSWLSKLEFKTYDQKIQLEELEKRLDQPRQMELAGSMDLAGEQSIPYSPRMVLILAMVFIGGFAGFYFNKPDDANFSPAILIVPAFFIGFLLIRWLPRMNKPAPLRFNTKELTVTDHPPVPWTNITDIRIEQRKYGKSKTPYLVVETTGSGNIELNIGELKGSATDIEDTLYQYWALAKKQTSKHS